MNVVIADVSQKPKNPKDGDLIYSFLGNGQRILKYYKNGKWYDNDFEKSPIESDKFYNERTA